MLLGEATDGTSEFYRMRERITRDLIVKKGFRFVAIEADWPDAARVDHYVRHFQYPPSEWTAFARFPTWMWRNTEVREFVSWLRKHNGTVEKNERVAFHGLDLYSLYNSIRSVLNYLDEVDPQSARVAGERYGCLTPWQNDPATYGHAALTGSFPTCELDVVRALSDLQAKRRANAEHDGERFLDAEQNAGSVANAERDYRIMYYGARASWNLRDTHMFETLKNLLAFHGADSKAVVWAHNSHVGNAGATEMAARGEHNIGQLCREQFGQGAYLIGFGTHNGTVAAASEWDGPMEIKHIRPALPNSYEQLCHATGLARFMRGFRSDLTCRSDRQTSLGWRIARSSRAMTPAAWRQYGYHFAFRNSADFQQHELVVVGLVGIAARGERQVVVVADDDVRLVDAIDVLDGEERERQHAVVERLARLLVGILDLHQVDIGDLAHRLADIGVGQFDLVDALEFGEVRKAVLAALALRAGLVRGAFAIVALDDQAAGGVDHVEVADGVAVLLEHVVPVAAGELFGGDVEFEDPRGFLAVDLFNSPSSRRPTAGLRAGRRGTCRPSRRQNLHSPWSGAD